MSNGIGPNSSIIWAKWSISNSMYITCYNVHEGFIIVPSSLLYPCPEWGSNR